MKAVGSRAAKLLAAADTAKRPHPVANYVAATRVAANLGSRFPNVTREAVLAGLASGDSLGETLRDLGVSERDAKEARKRAEREIKEARRRSL